MIFTLPRGAARRGFSLIEIMIALAMLTIVISSLFSQMFTLRESSEMNRARAAVGALTLGLSNAFAGAPFAQLRSSSLNWSLGRYCPSTAVALAPPISADATVLPGVDTVLPMTDEATASPTNCLLRYTSSGLAGLGILDTPTGLKNLKVWVEYYRGSDYDVNANGTIESTETGLLDSPPANSMPLMVPHSVYANHVPIFINSQLTAYRLTTAPNDQADPEGTVIIRVVMTYQIQASSVATAGANFTDYISSFVLARRR